MYRFFILAILGNCTNLYHTTDCIFHTCTSFPVYLSSRLHITLGQGAYPKNLNNIVPGVSLSIIVGNIIYNE